ncbi:itaconyl-CoA hydratase/mesaconyl-C4 CoA hydratase [Pseudomonas duriflava]|uniref:Itaconyl-CoA hydratase/mesaconyl-C4 CoA hydratase n=1 Tax=Pseudomonas duriflava TaxID=459528 RepID=A0A562Q9G4_9PSED|nr:MaoC family dehydratase N-terminal domain-containing protein [Pseudomonas duriflava]TWI53358.1 itaconyl-CoA hydratase/mesaconyl-C4 CoA hydratase [Pseudomonas duriflava]
MNDVDLSAWLGRSEVAEDVLSLNLVQRIAATFSHNCPALGEPLPPLWHWAFFQSPLPEAQLGEDGHPVRGSFLPHANNRNRMWAGGRLEFHQLLEIGQPARRESTILHVEEKTGRSGALLFVTVQHRYFQNDVLALSEEQDIVYREPSPPKAGSGDSLPAGTWSETIVPSSTLLFRYSAVTFNGHRIHYDWPYVTENEGYSGLVVHGPLIATLSLVAFQRANPEARLRRFAYRGVRPLIAPHPFTVGGCIKAPGHADVWAGTADGPAQCGEVEFE